MLAIAGWIAFTYASNDNPIVERFALRTALPRTPDGWRGNMTRSSNPSEVSLGGRSQFLSSNAWRTYTRDDTEITVEIWDWAGDYPYHLPIDIPGWANGELVRVGAEDGRLRYNDKSKRGRLRVRYLDRFYLVVEGDGIERYELEAWYHRIDLGGLRRELDKLRRASPSR